MNNTHTHTDTHNKKLSLRPPDNGSCSSITNTPPNTPVLSKIQRRNLSIEIPRWNTFTDNNEIPTMDFSPMYAKHSPNNGEQQLNPVIFRKHNNNNNNPQDEINTKNNRRQVSQNDCNNNRSFLIRCCEYFFS